MRSVVDVIAVVHKLTWEQMKCGVLLLYTGGRVVHCAAILSWQAGSQTGRCVDCIDAVQGKYRPRTCTLARQVGRRRNCTTAMEDTAAADVTDDGHGDSGHESGNP